MCRKAFALTGRNATIRMCPQGDALGYVLIGLSAHLKLNPKLEKITLIYKYG